MRIKLLIALLLTLLVIASVAHAQEATVEPTAAETTIEAPATEGEAVVEEVASEGETALEGEVAAEAETSAEGEAEAATETPAGSALLMLLLGLGAVALIGGVTMLRGNFKRPQD